MRLSGADPVLGVEMLSTGEVACLGKDFADALLKALQAAELNIPFKRSSVLITVGGRELKKKITPLAKALADMG
jgi:carbamoylphosphate synthase large subunit